METTNITFCKEKRQCCLEQGCRSELALLLEHSEFCQTELDLYQRLLGVAVVCEERIAAGGDCCDYVMGLEVKRGHLGLQLGVP